jgi:hypothetical protein
VDFCFGCFPVALNRCHFCSAVNDKQLKNAFKVANTAGEICRSWFDFFVGVHFFVLVVARGSNPRQVVFSFACFFAVPYGKVVNYGGDVAGECVVVLAKVGELSFPVVAPDAEACGVELGVEPCGDQGGECGCFGFHFLIFGFLFVWSSLAQGIEPAPGGLD